MPDTGPFDPNARSEVRQAYADCASLRADRAEALLRGSVGGTIGELPQNCRTRGSVRLRPLLMGLRAASKLT